MAFGVNNYPPQPNAGLLIEVAITTHMRSFDLWRMTTTTTEPFHLNTTLTDYTTELEPFLDTVWEYAQGRAAFEETTKVYPRYMIEIDNTTAPTPPTGARVQPKWRSTGVLTTEEYWTPGFLQERIENLIEWCRERAGY